MGLCSSALGHHGKIAQDASLQSEDFFNRALSEIQEQRNKLKKIDVKLSEELSPFLILNCKKIYILDLGTECMKHLINETPSEIFITYLQPLTKITDEADLNLLGAYLTKINFVRASYIQYKKLNYFKEDSKLSEKDKAVIQDLRVVWAVYSQRSSDFASRLVKDGILKELLQDFKNFNLSKEKHKAGFSVATENSHNSFILDPVFKVLYNLFIREQGKNISMKDKKRTVRCLKLYFKQLTNEVKGNSLPALIVLIFLDKDTKVVVKTKLIKFLTQEATRAMMTVSSALKISANDLLEALIKISGNASAKKKLLHQKVLNHVAVKALLTPASNWKDLAFRLLLELSFDKDGNNAIKGNQHIMMILEMHQTFSSVARQTLWMLDDEVALQTESLKRSLKSLKLKQEDFQSGFLLLHSNLGLTYALEIAVETVFCLLKFDYSNCHSKLEQLNVLFESQKDMKLIGDFLARIRFSNAVYAFLTTMDTEKVDDGVKKTIHEICLTYSTWSENFSTTLSTSKLVQELAQEIEESISLQGSSMTALELYTVIRTFYNIVRLSSQQNVLLNTKVLEVLQACAVIQTESMVAMTSVMTLALIYNHHGWIQDIQEDSAVKMIILNTSRALTNENHYHDRFSVTEFLRSLENICRVARFGQKLIHMNIITLAKIVLEKGTNLEMEYCENLLHELSKDSWCLQEMKKDKELVNWLNVLNIQLIDNFEINTRMHLTTNLSKKPKTANLNTSLKIKWLPRELTLDMMHENSQQTSTIPFNIKNELKEIELTAEEFYLKFGTMEVGQPLLSACKLGVRCVKYFKSGTESETLSGVEELRAVESSLCSDDIKTLGDFLCKIKFCEESYQRYKDILKLADLEHFDLNSVDKISVDGRQLLDVIRDSWKIFSGVSLQFALQVAESRILLELIQDMIIMMNKTEKDLDGSFLFTSSIGVLYNLAKFTDIGVSNKIQKVLQHEKLVDILGNFLHFKPELNLPVLLMLALIVDKSQIHLLISHSSIFSVLPCTKDEWEEKKSHYGNISIIEILMAITNIAKNEKLFKILISLKRDILSLILNVLKFGDEVEKKQALNSLWELSLEENIQKKIKANTGLIICVKNLANVFENEMTEVTAISRMILNNISNNNDESQQKQSREEIIKSMISYISLDEEKVSRVIESLSAHMDILKCVDGIFVNNETLTQADVLLICVTFQFLTYGQTLSTIRQAFKLNKPIIFLIFEKEIKMESWIENLIGSEMVYDLTVFDETVISELMEDIKKLWAKSSLITKDLKNRKILAETLPEMLDSYPWDTLNSYSEVISSKEITKALNKLKLPNENVQSLLNILKENRRMFTAFKCVAQCTICLSGASDLACYSTLEELLTRVRQPREKENILMGQFLCHFEFCGRSLSKYRSVLKLLDTKHACKLEDKKNIPDLSRCIITNLFECWRHFSKCSSSFADHLAKSEIFQELENEVIELIGTERQNLERSFVFESCINIIYNMATLPSLRQKFRERQFVYALGNFLSYDISLTPKLLVTIGLIIDEYQTHLLISQPYVFNRLLPRNKAEWTSQNHGISCKDLLSTLNELSKKDKVKELLVEKDILLLITDILKSETSSAGEKEEAVKLLMELSFSCDNKARIKSLIYESHAEKPYFIANKNINSSNQISPADIKTTNTKTDPELLHCLKTLMDKGNSESRKAANRILWWLQKDMKANETSVQAPSGGTGHIMISYNSSDRETLKKVYDSLRYKGYKVWMDIYEIKGSSLDAMAKAVENSELILMCMSEKYKESANCRLEAEYAANCGKPIIPLLMQHSYKPNGWLGILLGSKIFYDFSGEKYKFEDKMQDLIREIGSKGRTTNS